MDIKPSIAGQTDEGTFGDPLISPPPGEYPQFKGDAAKTSNASDDGAAEYYLAWSLGEGGYSSPLVMYDKIYSVANRAVSCFNFNGTKIWSHTTYDNHWNTPLIYGDYLFIPGKGGDLWCLDANGTGDGGTTEYWKFTPEDPLRDCASSPVTDGMRVFYTVETTENGMNAVWIDNGTLAWNASLDGSRAVETCPTYWNGRIYTGAGNSYGDGSRYLYCFNSTNGDLNWKYSTPRVVVSTPAVEYGRVYFGCMDSKVYCLDAVGSGGVTTSYWTHSVSPSYYGIYSSPAVAYGRVYIGDLTSNANLYCLDAYGSGGTTTEYWKVSCTPGGNYGMCSSPTVTPNYIYLGTSANAFHCRNRTTGLEVWSRVFTSENGHTYGICTSPAVSKGYTIFKSDDGLLYMVGPKTDHRSPLVVSHYPENLQEEVDPLTNISVEFDEDIDPLTFSTTSFMVTSKDGQVDGSFFYDEDNLTVIFNPDEALSKSRTYNITLETTITDVHANGLDGDGDGEFEGVTDIYTFQFSTIAYIKPVITLTSLKALEDVPRVVDLRTYIFDVDTPFDMLIIEENSTYANIDDGVMTLLYPQGVLYDLINLSVSDEEYTIYREISVNIDSENDLPYFDPIPTIDPVEDIDYVLDLSDLVHDADGDLLFIHANSTFAREEGLNITFNYPNGVLYDLVNISLTDGIAFNWAVIEIFVIPVNDAPVIVHVNNLMDDLINISVDEDRTLVMDVVVYDIDGPDPTTTLEGEVPRMSFDHFTRRIIYSPIQVDVGLHTVKLIVRDGSDPNLSDNVTINILVRNVNDAPLANPIYHVGGGNANLTVTFSTSPAYDEDGDVLFYTWRFGDGGSCEDMLIVNHTYRNPGRYNITLKVTDGKDQSYSYMEIEVTAPPSDVIDDGPPTKKTENNPNTTGDEDRPSTEKEIISPLMLILLILALLAVVCIILMASIFKSRDDDEGDIRWVWDVDVAPDQIMKEE